MSFNSNLPLEPRPPWSAAQDNQALRLEENGLSRRQIALVMKMSRSAIAGRLWRLKNGATSMPIATIVAPELVEEEEPEEVVELQKVSTLLPVAICKTDPTLNTFHPQAISNAHIPRPKPAISSLFLPLRELPEGTCKFPVGGRTCCEKEHLFCGEAAYIPPGKKYHSPYCLEHHRIAYYRGY